MRSPVSRILLSGGTMLTLASLFIFLSPRVEAANGPFNGKIAFTSNRDGNFEIYVMNADGTGQARLTNNSATESNPAWSPDGKKIAFDSNRDGIQAIYVMNADGTNQTRLTTDSNNNTNPAWSPDGKKIAFRSFRAGNTDIFVMNADGTNQVQLTTSAGQNDEPSWSPDGQKICFHSNRDGNFEIYVMNADGTNQTRLTNNSNSDFAPSFSPNGKKISFQGQVSSGLDQIFTMDADGTNLAQLTSINSNNAPAPFSPDGRKIAFISNRDGNNEIYTMNADGTNQVRLTNSPSSDSDPDWQPVFSPESIGVFRPSTGQWLLRNTPTAGAPDITLSFGQQGDLPVTGDWNGDGRTDIGVFRNGTFLLATLKTVLVHSCLTCPFTFSTSFDTLPSFTFGQAGDLPVAGDWNGDGVDDVGVFRNGRFLLRQPTTLCFGCRPIITTIGFDFGQAGDKPVAGDWNRDGIDTIGVYRPGIGTWFLRNSNTAGSADQQFLFGTNDFPFVGDWNGDGFDSVGTLTDDAPPTIFLSNGGVSGGVGVVDITIPNYASSGDLPVAGDWNGANNPPNSGVNDPSSGSSRVGQTQTFTTTCSDPDGWHDISTIDFKIAKSDGQGNGVPLALWVQFDEGSNVIRFYNPDSQTWTQGTPRSNVILSSRFAEINLAGTHVEGSGPTGPSVQITWSIVFKDGAILNNYKQYLKITDDSGLTTGFDKVGSWSVTR